MFSRVPFQHPDFGDRLMYICTMCITDLLFFFVSIIYIFARNVLLASANVTHIFGAIFSFNRFNLVVCETVGNLPSTRIDR